MDKTNIFIPFSKKDDEKQLVYGYASTEAIDSQGEIVEKKAIIEALPGYMKFGNIREMHQPSAVGKAKQANIDENGLFIKVKVVDKGAWEKVKEGVYNGFSIGGRVVSKVGNRIKELTLSEISLVDRPANPAALFTVVKADDISKEVEGEVTNEKVDEAIRFMDSHVSIMEVSEVLEMAKYLVYMITDRIFAGKSYEDLEDALVSLKAASREILGEGAIERLDEIISLAKAKGDDEANFAYITPTGAKLLPMATKELAELSFKKFYLTSFASTDHKIMAAKLLQAVAKHFEIKLEDKNIDDISNMELSVGIKKGYSDAYSNYFNNMRMAIG